jgi:hypothetical protein
VFHPTRFASPQLTLLPLTPQDSMVVSRASPSKRRAFCPSPMPRVLLFEVVPAGQAGVMSGGRPGGLGQLRDGNLRPWLSYHMARMRAGPPDAPFTLGKPTKIVAPRAGIFPRFARFSSPHLLAGKIV